jgi:hypothetical protein
MSEEIFTVFAQVQEPRDMHPGIVVEGAYKVIDGEVILVHRDGQIARDDRGKVYKQKLAPGDIAKGIAARLTKQLRLSLRGKHTRVQGFAGPLRYPPSAKF